METVRVLDLEIGDIVRPICNGKTVDGPYRDCTVYNVDKDNVYLVRPYIATADFTCTAGVITHMGEEKYTMYRNADAITLLESNDPDKTRNAVRAIVDDIRHCLETGQIAAAKEKLRSL